MAPWLLKRNVHFSTMIAVISLATLSQGIARDDRTSVRALRREKRGWVWNQFFVLEEYAEDKPLYVGKVCKHVYSTIHCILLNNYTI